MRCRKCWSQTLVDASAELVGASAELGTWMKCFQCGWRGRPLTGRGTVVKDKDTETQRRHCHAPGIREEFCTGYPLKGQDYCRKHLEERLPHPTREIIRATMVDAGGKTSRPMPPVALTAPADQELDVRPSSIMPVVSAPTIGEAVDRVIARLSADLSVLEQAREILQREA